jgi:lipopolysaccharide transport system permease protein
MTDVAVPPPSLTAAAPAGARKPLVTLRPPTRWAALRLGELFEFRDLLLTLAQRDVKLRYKQTLLGVAWVVLQPLLAAGIFTFVFSLVAKLPSDGVPYFLFSFAGLLGWNLFNNTLTRTSACLVNNANLISKIFFPRLVLPVATMGSALVDFAVAAGMMGALLIAYRWAPPPALLLLPVWLAILAAIALGFGLWTAALSVSYRDVQYILPVVTQILLYASPVPYGASAVPKRLLAVYYLNPLSAPLEAVRWSLLGTAPPPIKWLAYAAVLAAAVLAAGLVAFKRMERKFADVI